MSEVTNGSENVLNKGGILEAMLAKQGGDFASKAAADRVVRGIFSLMSDHIAAGGTVRIQDFGTFETYESAARTGRNPQTKEEMEIPASTRVRFHAAKALKDAVNRK